MTPAPAVAEPAGPDVTGARWWRRISPARRDAAIIALLAIVSIVCLKKDQLAFITQSPWEGFGAVLPHTVWAALKVWTFWTVGAAVIGGILLRMAPELGVVDAVISGFCGVWIFAYVGGNALGPIGLFRAWVIWPLLAAGGWWLLRRGFPKIRVGGPTAGQKLVLLTFALAAPGLLFVQLGSPVPPYMDILATPAAAQRIITFGRYFPFDNDPYGYWDPSSQLPGLELFYALLGIGSGTSLGLLADTAALLPMISLMMLATYRLGKTIGGDLMGGMATLFLFATIFFRVMTYMHGRAVAFVLVAIGLAFFLDERRHGVRIAIGALALATAVASHAIIGALGMAVAGTSVLMWLLSAQLRAGLLAVAVLVGAALVALPTVAIGLRIVVPYPTLPAVQLLGIVIIVTCARALHGRRVNDHTSWLRWPLALAGVWVLLRHPAPWMSNNHHQRFPILVYGAGLGLALMLWSDIRATLPWPGRERRPSARLLLGPVTLALLLGVEIEHLSNRYWPTFKNPSIQTAVHDWFYKVDYWYPFVLVFPTAFLAAWLARTVSRRATVLVALAVLMLPWRDRIDPAFNEQSISDPNAYQHSIVEGWAYQIETGKRGYWGQTGDRRWAQSEAELALADVLRAEIAAGRITPETHVVHLAPRVLLYGDNLLFSVYTGINDDAYLANHEFDASIHGSRLRPIEQVLARLAERPPYVVIHKEPVTLDPDLFQGYTEIFNREGIRLLRDDAQAGWRQSGL